MAAMMLVLVFLVLFHVCMCAQDAVPVKGVQYAKGIREKFYNIEALQNITYGSYGYNGPKVLDLAGPISTADTSNQAAFLFYGGRVITNIQIVVVLWGVGPYSPGISANIFDNGGRNLPAFYTQLVNGTYVNFISTDYSTLNLYGQDGRPGYNQRINSGAFVSAIQITPIYTSSLIYDSQIAAELQRQISLGVLPTPTPDATGTYNTVYMVHFPTRITVNFQSMLSCDAFCGYHGSTTTSGPTIYYSVLPDISGCLAGCAASGSRDAFDSHTSVASHEFAEVITDPDVSQVSAIGRPLTWYDLATGEIADTCLALGATYTGTNGINYLVQKLYSRSSRSCVGPAVNAATAPPATAPPTPPPTPAPNDFELDVTLVQSGAAKRTYTIQLPILSGLTESIALSLSGLPKVVTSSFSANPLMSGVPTSTLILSFKKAPKKVAISFTVTAQSKTKTKTSSTLSFIIDGLNLQNAGFEAGLTSWKTTGTVTVSAKPNPVKVGLSAIALGDLPGALTTLSQTFTLPPLVTTITFSYLQLCNDFMNYGNWFNVTIIDLDTSDNIKVVLNKICVKDTVWQLNSMAIKKFAGHYVKLLFSSQDDGFPGDPVITYIDDIKLIKK